MNKLTKTQELISKECDNLKALLIYKNEKYGDSAMSPKRVFATSNSLEQLRVRIDDKLNRIKNQQGTDDEDTIQDLIGYLVLYHIALKEQPTKKEVNIEMDELIKEFIKSQEWTKGGDLSWLEALNPD